jgi:RNA polymerase sigma factor (sigma-70 family)
LSNVSNQGITVLPGRRFHAGRASAPSVRPREETNQDAQQEAELQAMPINDDHQKARRFREAALPYLDDVYTLARYLLRDASDAEDAVQECYLRALKHFDSYRGPAMKPWLFAILRNVCHAEYARRAHSHAAIEDAPEVAEQTPLWRETEANPETEVLRSRDASAIRKLIDALAEPFKETFVLREINNLSYREIADAVGAPVGTVMSRLARARAMLRAAWMAEEEHLK